MQPSLNNLTEKSEEKMSKINRRISTTINGKKVEAQTIGGLNGIRTGLYLKKTFIPVAGAGINGLQSEKGMEEIFTACAQKISEGMEVDKLMSIILGLCEHLVVDNEVIGNGEAFDDYFDANYGEFLEILAWLLKENFKSLFTVKDLSKKASEAVMKASSALFSL